MIIKNKYIAYAYVEDRVDINVKLVITVRIVLYYENVIQMTGKADLLQMKYLKKNA